jgi:polyhydroxybutyrate depolymerase
VAFLDAVVTASAAATSIDRTRVYVVGMSNGAFMANRYACERPANVAGIGLVAGTISPDALAACSARGPVPSIHFHGTADAIVPDAGGTVGRNRGEAVGVEPMLTTWQQLNRCTGTPVTTTAPGLTSRTWSCTARTVAHRLEGAGHVWPGTRKRSATGATGPATDAIDATAAMWAFFTQR